MTGFGKASTTIPGKKITVELKSLNSKQLDLQTRLPYAYRSLDLEMRRLIALQLERGKVELLLTVEQIGEPDSLPQINIAAAKAYRQQIQTLASELAIPEPSDWYATLLRLPEIIHSTPAPDTAEDEGKAILQALNQAIDALMAHRREEGRKLEDFFATRLQNITTLLSEIPQWEKERTQRVYARLEEALASLAQEQIDRGRLEQEMIFYIEKLDVSEERQRLSQHLLYFAETMAQTNPGQGKKLGFIAQEMGREINTLGSKSNHAQMQKQVVKMKDELEQIKEQVLNVM